MIQIECPECRRPGKAHDDHYEQKVRCKHCQCKFRIRGSKLAANTIDVECPHCFQLGKAPDHFFGKAIHCEHCKVSFRISDKTYRGPMLTTSPVVSDPMPLSLDDDELVKENGTQPETAVQRCADCGKSIAANSRSGRAVKCGSCLEATVNPYCKECGEALAHDAISRSTRTCANCRDTFNYS